MKDLAAVLVEAITAGLAEYGDKYEVRADGFFITVSQLVPVPDRGSCVREEVVNIGLDGTYLSVKHAQYGYLKQGEELVDLNQADAIDKLIEHVKYFISTWDSPV